MSKINSMLGAVIFFSLAVPFTVFAQHETGGDHQMNMQTNLDDAQFLDHMSMHHQQAVDMAKMAIEKSQNPKIKSLSQKVIADQTKEIEQMKTWRQKWFSSTPQTTMNMGDSSMGGLQSATGKEFDQWYLDMMSKHHEDGIKMAKSANLKKPEVKKLATNIVQKQAKEIKEMSDLKTKL